MNPQHLDSYFSTTSPERQRRVLSPRRWRSGLVVLLFVLPMPAQAQSERNKPYELNIVVHVAPNRLLTDVFRERIERELHDGFQAALGDMGRVKVTHEHPRLADVLARGLKLSLDGWKEHSDAKTHFVLVGFSGVHYEIQTRQYDGTTGRASPVVRRKRTRDRDFVAKATALLIKQDFGILGTIVSGPEGPQQQVTVELQGGGLGDLSRWVRKDEVFALAPPRGGSPNALRWAILQVEEPPSEQARDVCKCRFFHRYLVPNLLGYRCIKLGTVQTALRLRWMRETPNGLRPLGATINMDIRRHGFEGEEATKLSRGTTGRTGVLDMAREGDKGVFAHVAFVRVTAGPVKTLPQVPVPLYDDQLISIEVNTAQGTNNLFNVSKAAWQREVYESLLVQVDIFKELELLAAKNEKREDIIQKAERGLKRSQLDRESLLQRKVALLKEAKESGIKVVDTKREDDRLKEMVKGEGILEQFILAQKKIDLSENDPKLKMWRSEVERAKLLEKDLEYGKAIDIYARIQGEGFQDAGLDRHLKELRKYWKTGDAELEEARTFIYRIWPTLDTARLKEKLPTARKAFKKCEAAGDIIPIRKMLEGAVGHAVRLEKELSELAFDDAEAKPLKETSSALTDLFNSIQEYLKKQAGDK